MIKMTWLHCFQNFDFLEVSEPTEHKVKFADDEKQEGEKKDTKPVKPGKSRSIRFS